MTVAGALAAVPSLPDLTFDAAIAVERLLSALDRWTILRRPGDRRLIRGDAGYATVCERCLWLSAWNVRPEFCACGGCQESADGRVRLMRLVRQFGTHGSDAPDTAEPSPLQSAAKGQATCC